jgi:hypothetical protein
LIKVRHSWRAKKGLRDCDLVLPSAPESDSVATGDVAPVGFYN